MISCKIFYRHFRSPDPGSNGFFYSIVIFDMKRIWTLLSIIIVLTAACKKPMKDQCPSTVYQYTFQRNAEVDTSRAPANWLIATSGNGTKLVFNYTRNYTTCPEIADGGSTDILFFEVDAAATSFDYDPTDFQQFMVYFRRICFCPENGFIVPQDGNIKGTRVDDNSWNVEFDLILDDGEHIKNSGVFRLQ
jgi:hypothetical protein